MIRLARGANCGGKAVSGSADLASIEPAGPLFHAIRPIEDASVPRNIEPIPPVNERKKCRRV